MAYLLILLGSLFVGSFVIGIILCLAFYIGSVITLFIGSVWLFIKFIFNPIYNIIHFFTKPRRC